MIAEAMELPLFRRQLTGTSVNQELYYEKNGDAVDEVEDLYELLV